MFDVIDIDFSRYSSGMQNPTKRGTFGLAFFMGAVAALARRRVRRARRHPGRAVLEQPLCRRHVAGAGAAVRARARHGDSVADRWRRSGGAAEAGRVDGARQAGLRRPHPRHGHLLRLPRRTRCLRTCWVDSAEVSGSVQEKLEKGWTNSLAAGLDRAEREGKPVLIDFWATWCKNCLTMDKTTLEDPAVVAALDNYVEDQVPGRGSGRGTGEVGDGAVQRDRPPDLRHPEPEGNAHKLSRPAEAVARASAAPALGLQRADRSYSL